MKTPGQRIKDEREGRGWSQQRLADEISRLKKEKISRAAVAQWEGGSSKTQKPENLFAAAKALGLHPQWVLDETGERHISPTGSVADPHMAATPNLHQAPVATYDQIKAVIAGVLSAYGLNYVDLVPNEKAVKARIMTKLLPLSDTEKLDEDAEFTLDYNTLNNPTPGMRDGNDVAEIKKDPRKRVEGGQ